ncbi:MAG: class I SAM-dependent methyltransferase [Dehalococcoidia bacterium]
MRSSIIGERVPDAARLGNPSFVWRSGQERRLAIIERYVSLNGRRVLDLGCGLGEYVRAFERQGAEAYGCDIEQARLAQARERGTANVLVAAGEALPFRDGSLDVVVLNEVIEHVQDDGATMREVSRVLAPGGVAVIYAPNRLYPFETHGVYLGKRYVFGNIPLVNWLPNPLRNRLVPHARAYTARGIERVSRQRGLRLVHHSYVYPGFDNVAARVPMLARLLRWSCYRAEDSALRRFGLSHLLVLHREEAAV